VRLLEEVRLEVELSKLVATVERNMKLLSSNAAGAPSASPAR